MVEIRYEAGRNSDYMLTHFQCKIFHLCNIKGQFTGGDESERPEYTGNNKKSIVGRVLDPVAGGDLGNMSMLRKMSGFTKK